MRHAGAIEFMAPEQNEGQMLFQTDIYSYGVILFELLTGQVTFPLKDNGETARNSVMIAHMEAPVPDILELRRQNLPGGWNAAKQEQEMMVPAWLLNMVARCLEKVPEGRYSDGRQLHETLALNSISAVQDQPFLAVLKAENEQLRAEVLKYRQEVAQNGSGINISKYVFGAMLILSAIGIIGLARPIFSKQSKAALPLHDSSTRIIPPATLKTNTGSLPVKKAIFPDTSAVNKDTTGINIPNNDSVISAAKAAAAKKKHHKKRKKFLGIF